MNDYVVLYKKKNGKKVVSIKCVHCNLRKEVQFQTQHKTNPYSCKSCSTKGEKNGMFGKGYLLTGENNGNFGGIPEERKRKISKSKTGLKPNLSEEERKIRGIRGAKHLVSWMKDNPELHKEGSRKGGVNSLKLQSDHNRISTIEKITIDWLNSKDIEFEFQFPLKNRYLYDFRIKNKIIEVNGKWFHSQEKQIIKDKLKKEFAIKEGYQIFYIWEDDVRKGNFTNLERFIIE